MAARRASRRALAGAALAALIASTACSAILGVKGDRELSIDGDDDAGADAAIDASSEIATEGSAPSDGALPFDLPLARTRADEALEVLLLNFWTGETFANVSGATPVSAFAQSWAALIDAVARHRDARFHGMIRTFYDAAKGAGWSF